MPRPTTSTGDGVLVLGYQWSRMASLRLRAADLGAVQTTAHCLFLFCHACVETLSETLSLFLSLSLSLSQTLSDSFRFSLTFSQTLSQTLSDSLRLSRRLSHRLSLRLSQTLSQTLSDYLSDSLRDSLTLRLSQTPRWGFGSFQVALRILVAL